MKIVYTRPDGGVSVVHPAPQWLAKVLDDTDGDPQFPNEAAAMAFLLTKDVPPGSTDVNVVTDGAIPTDRTFRGAWEQTAGSITVDMPKARAVHAVSMAQAKVAESARLELAEEELILLSKTGEAAQAAADKAAVDGLNLATLATQMAAAPNPTALKAIWPAELPR
jgi:hypothetical protein